MAIRAGQILHLMNQFVIDRIQTGGPGNLNIPQEKVYELGNYQTVGIVRDIPDLTFGLDCLDVDTEVEALLTGSVNPSADAAGTKYELLRTRPIDVTSPWKSPYGEFNTVKGVVLPNLALESVSYRYGLRDNAGEQYSLRGDAIYYVPGSPWQDIFVGDGTLTAFAFEHGPAIIYREGGKTIYALSVSVDGEQLSRGSDFTDTATGVTLKTAPKADARVSVVYGSAVAQTFPQTGRTPYADAGATTPDDLTHQGLGVKPAAIRGKDIDVFFSTLVNGTPVEVRWPDVQAATIDWRATLESDYEFGNPTAVSRDYTDVPDVSGSITIRPRSVDRLFERMQQITGVPATEIIGPQSSVIGGLRIELRNPDSGGATSVPAGTVLKTHYVPDCRFTIPGYEGRVQQKTDAELPWTSDTGSLETFKGARV